MELLHISVIYFILVSCFLTRHQTHAIECGVSHGCLYINREDNPEPCALPDCDLQLLYKQIGNGGDMEFTVSGKVSRNEYIALGLSDDTRMGTDEVYTCREDGVHRLYTPGAVGTYQPPVAQTTTNIRVLSVEYESGTLRCKFSRDNEGGDGAAEAVENARDLTEPTHFIFTYGPVYNDGSIGKHVPGPAVTRQSVLLGTGTDGGGTTTYRYLNQSI